MSIAALNTMITSHNNDRKTNVNDGRQYQRDREDDVNRPSSTMRKRTRQTTQNTYSIASSTNERYNCPNINDSMENYYSSYFNSNYREYEPSYPSITRYHRSSPYRKTHYLDDSDEEIIKDEIVEIIN